MMDEKSLNEVLSRDPNLLEIVVFAVTSIAYTSIVLLQYKCGFDESDLVGRSLVWIDRQISEISQILPVTIRYEAKMRTAGYTCNIPLIRHVYAANSLLLALSAVAILLRAKRHMAELRQERQQNLVAGIKVPTVEMGVVGSVVIGLTTFALWFWGNMAIGESSWANSRVYADKWYVFLDTLSCSGMLVCFQGLVSFVGISRLEKVPPAMPRKHR